MDFADQLRGARGILNWSRKDLAERAGMSEAGLAKIESGESRPTMQTHDSLVRAIESGGVRLTKNGVEQQLDMVTLYTGEGWFLKLLDDVYFTLLDQPGAELLVDMADDRVSPPEVVNRYRKIRNAGIRMRQTVEEGNDYLMGPVAEYRWVPKRHYKNWVSLIYGDKVAMSVANEAGCRVIKDTDLAGIQRNKFDMVWESLPELTIESKADDRF